MLSGIKWNQGRHEKTNIASGASRTVSLRTVVRWLQESGVEGWGRWWPVNRASGTAQVWASVKSNVQSRGEINKQVWHWWIAILTRIKMHCILYPKAPPSVSSSCASEGTSISAFSKLWAWMSLIDKWQQLCCVPCFWNEILTWYY